MFFEGTLGHAITGLVGFLGLLAYLGLGVLTAEELDALAKKSESKKGLGRLGKLTVMLVWPIIAVIAAAFVALVIAALALVIGFILAVVGAIIGVVLVVIAFIIVAIAGILVIAVAFCVLVLFAIIVLSPFVGIGRIGKIVRGKAFSDNEQEAPGGSHLNGSGAKVNKRNLTNQA